MSFNSTINIVDMVMGGGKSSAAINYINNCPDDEKIIYITPYNKEITERILIECKKKNVVKPQKYGTKLRGIKDLINKGRNIASTHALFHLFDQECIDMCRAQNYTLIMDEVTDVIEEYYISKQDFDVLMENYVYIDEKTNLIKWREDQMDYCGKFNQEKHLCEFNCLAYYGGSIMMWLFPTEVFNAFRKAYILTYKFDSQIQRYYYDYYKVPYRHIWISGNSKDTYSFSETPIEYQNKYDYKSLIHILDNQKMNEIGDSTYDLSLSWYRRNSNNVVMSRLRKNLTNYFRNIRNTKTSLNLWTTFKDFKSLLSDKGYGRAFLVHNARAVNDYGDRISIAYPINRFLNATIKKFFTNNGVEVDEDGYALSEMLQFIWRSAIRNGKEIWVYVPSVRMRTLLENWIKENSI